MAENPESWNSTIRLIDDSIKEWEEGMHDGQNGQIWSSLPAFLYGKLLNSGLLVTTEEVPDDIPASEVAPGRSIQTSETVTSSGKFMRMTVIKDPGWEEQFYIEKMTGRSAEFIVTQHSLEALRQDLISEFVFSPEVKENLLLNLDRIIEEHLNSGLLVTAKETPDDTSYRE